MANTEKAHAHTTDVRLTACIVDVLGAVERHYPELEDLPDRKVVSFQVRVEEAIRTAFGIEGAARQGVKHGG
jgi:hypothetical protein